MIKRRRASVTVLGVLALTTALVAASPASAANPTAAGTFTVKPGYTATLSGMNINSNDVIYVYYCESENLPGGVNCVDFGTNDGQTGNVNLDSVSFANPKGGSAETRRIGVYDYTAFVMYMSDHVAFNYDTGSSTVGWQGFNHAVAGKIKGALHMSINDGSSNPFMNWVPTLGSGTFNVTVDIARTPS